MTDLVLVGRSSSHFTRTARIFALELGVPHTFRPVLDITSTEPANYAGNPALKMPVLVDADGPLFGTENICRELARRSHAGARVILVMATMGGVGRVALPKLRQSLENSLSYLNESFDRVLDALPADRAISFVETALFCVVTHLPFRQVMDVGAFERLKSFSEQFGKREGARQTEYRFDAP
jgi:hypothetical protein